MDEDTRDLVAQLCTRFGMIMEDASLSALQIVDQADLKTVHSRMAELRRASTQVQAYLDAALALLD